MSSAVRPTYSTRVTMLMKTNLLMDSLRNNSVAMLKVQNQLTSGLKIARPSDNPGDATIIMHLDSQLEQQQQYLDNLDYATDFLSTTDNALGQAIELVQEAHSLALESIGTTIDDAGRASNALIIDQIIKQLTTIGNYSARGSYIFAGQNSNQPPFEAYAGGIRFTGNLATLQTAISVDNPVGFNANADEAFGTLSSQVVGAVDYQPALTRDTLLSDLNGALQLGVRRGSIIVSDGTDSATIDLSNCVTVGDVIDKIQTDAPPGIVDVRIDPLTQFGLQIIPDINADVTVQEVGTGYTARDLGLYTPTGAGIGVPLSGQDVDARLTLVTPLNALTGVAGIDFNDGLTITNSLLAPASVDIDLSTTATLGDLLNAINHAGIGVYATLNDERTAINIYNQISGSQMTIAENGGNTATLLGIRSLTAATTLDQLNNGQGVATSNDAGDGLLRITTRDDTIYDINLASAQTIQDVIDLINTATAGHVTAALTVNGNGLQLTDNLSGAANFSVTTASQNGFLIAQQLGFSTDGADGLSQPSDSLTALDVNPVTPDGVFSHLLALRDALLANDDADISAAAAQLELDRKTISDIHGQVGAQARTLEDRRYHLEDNILATETLRSDIRDVDFTEAITRYQNLQTALQANLLTGSEMMNVSLLDFLT